MTLDHGRWHEQLRTAIAARRVPGATLAVLAGGEVMSVAAGVLHVGTGVEATVDSLFQVGSITKVWTTALLMQLIAEGRLALDTRVIDVLPDFSLSDQDVAEVVTVEHLVTHTSGIDGDIFIDTGRGDDCVERYVELLADAAQLHPMGATFSYCNSGFIIAGRMIEVLTGQGWDTVLRRRLIEPLGLTHTVTLPEDVLRYRAAMGHTGDTNPRPAPTWGLARSAGPAGLICARAEDIVAFAGMHLRHGTAPGGEEIVPADAVEAMQRPHADVPDPTRSITQWGLGWALADWDGGRVYGHDGGTIGQSAFLRVAPDHDVAIALLTNGGDTGGLFHDIYGPLLQELCGITVPTFAPPADAASVDGSSHIGTYERSATKYTVTETSGGLRGHVEWKGELGAINSPADFELIAVTDDIWAKRSTPESPWDAWCFYQLDDTTPYLHAGLRATPKVA